VENKMNSFDHEALVDYLRRWNRTQPARWQFRSVEELGAEFERDAHFAAVRLANWLGTPDVRLVTAAVATALPASDRFAVALVTRAIVLAADRRRSGRAWALVLGSAAAAALLFAATW
jgi:hypothetical protein